jgi:hypothetical protein
MFIQINFPNGNFEYTIFFTEKITLYILAYFNSIQIFIIVFLIFLAIFLEYISLFYIILYYNIFFPICQGIFSRATPAGISNRGALPHTPVKGFALNNPCLQLVFVSGKLFDFEINKKICQKALDKSI